jgi:hypothetical protein
MHQKTVQDKVFGVGKDFCIIYACRLSTMTCLVGFCWSDLVHTASISVYRDIICSHYPSMVKFAKTACSTLNSIFNGLPEI